MLSITTARLYSSKSPFPINHDEIQKQRAHEKLPRFQRWAAYMQTEKFKKSMAIYYFGGSITLGVIFYFYMRDRYHEDIQIDLIKGKYAKDPSSLTEYEYLILKKLNLEKLRSREDTKFKLYQMMRKEFRRKNLLDTDAIFNPTPQELEEWYEKQAKPVSKSAPILDQPIMGGSDSENPDSTSVGDNFTNATNPNIVPAQDTTEFYENMASDYDSEIAWEERVMFLGSRRKWLMKQARGDVLEVACGTGRNIPYFYPDHAKSITFIDSSRSMVETAQKKFQAAFPNYHRAAFTVGRAEDLARLGASSSSGTFKYDTIIEAFGLCAHEDPVAALKNMTQMLKPGGRIVLLEHGRLTWGFINNHLDFRSKRRMQTWACRWNLDIGELIDDAGLDITYEKRVHLGSTWLLVCKRLEDPLRPEEKSFFSKLFSRDRKPIDKGN